MNMLYVFVKEDNEVSINLLEKYGCKIGVVIRDYVYKQGCFYNAFIITMLLSEYKSLKKKLGSILETILD